MCRKGSCGILVICFLLLSKAVVFGQMNGSYTVGLGSQYETISDAIADINSNGLSGDVTLNISSGIYVEYVDLSNLNNGAFTVTLNGEDLNSTFLSPTYQAISFSTGINIQDTDNITIRNLTIRMPFESATATQEMFGIYVEDASNISIENSAIRSFDGIKVARGNNTQLLNTIVSAENMAFEAMNCNSLDLIHNTLHSNQTGVAATESVTRFEGDNLAVSLTNNIFSGVAPSVANGNAAIEVLNNLENLELTANFNLFDADLSMTVHGESSNTRVNNTEVFGNFSLTDWSNLVGLDGNSLSLSPVFTNSTDFRIETTDYRFGTYLANYSTDIDGDMRFDGVVDVGADQYCAPFDVTESIEACESFAFDGVTLTASGEYVGEFISMYGCDSLVTLNLTILEPTAGSDEITAEGSYDWNGVIYSETGTYEQVLTGQNGCDSVATLNLTIEPYFFEGTFIIGSSEEADFESFEEAVADLQYATLTGDVDYTVEAGTYNETLKISEIDAGDHNISFIGEDKSTTILHPMGSIEESKAGVLITGTNNVILQNLTLEMDDISAEQVLSSEATAGISIVEADNIILDNLELKNESETSAYDAGRFFITHALSIESVNTLTVSNSTFSDARFHFTIGSHNDVRIEENIFSTARELIRNTETGSNLSIKNNDLTGPFQSGITLSGLEGVSILSNQIDGVDQESSFTGIGLEETSGSIIRGNRIENVGTGIELYFDHSAIVNQNIVLSIDGQAVYVEASEDLTMVNNFFADVVLLERQSNLEFIHNTLVSASSNERDDVLFFEVNDEANENLTVNISNNIMVGGSEVTDRLVGIVTVNENEDFSLDLTLDHNLYYLDDDTGLKPVVTYEDNEGETSHSTLADWQTAEPYDQNSQSFEPSFISADDFHISSDVDYRFGTFIDDVTTDIDGDNRVESIGVDVGADQFCLTYDEVVDIEVCESYTFDEVELTTSGQYQASFLTVQSCDSLVTLNLTILEPTSGEEEVSSCESYEWNGTTYTESGTYTDMFTNAAGRDSTATLVLEILEATSGSAEVSSCESYEWEGTTYTVSGSYTALLTSAAGCDSTATLDLTILESTSSEEEVQACASYEWNDVTYTKSGTYTEAFTNAAGCDSTATLILELFEEVPETVTVSNNGGTLTAEVDDQVYTVQWLNCDGDQVVEGATASEFVPEASGSYAVRVTNGECEVVSSCIDIEEEVLSVRSSIEISVFPNPATGPVTLQFDKVMQQVQVSVYQASGRLVKSVSAKKASQMNIELEEAGIYLLHVKEKGRPVEVFKVIKE